MRTTPTLKRSDGCGFHQGYFYRSSHVATEVHQTDYYYSPQHNMMDHLHSVPAPALHRTLLSLQQQAVTHNAKSHCHQGRDSFNKL